ncbi:hypothetical protein KEM60_02595 [Austwickia sp. TVS 96-490-7B]|nr:hypothetical protein [Austwickia sp. TVS 96-490-7B]
MKRRCLPDINRRGGPGACLAIGGSGPGPPDGVGEAPPFREPCQVGEDPLAMSDVAEDGDAGAEGVEALREVFVAAVDDVDVAEH